MEYWWIVSNETEHNNSNMEVEEMLQDPAVVMLFIGYPRWLLNFAAACCILFMLIGIPGNLITMAALFHTKKLKNATAIFIMNLSVSDAMFCCFNLPLATSTFWHNSWLYGPLLCRLFPLLRYGLVAVSLFTVLAITINRYVMIGHPSLYPTLFKKKYLMPMILGIWFAAFGVLIITWFGRWGRFGLDPVIGSCSILPDVNGRSPKEFLFVLAFLAPCIAITVCYARIFYIVRKTALKSRGKDKVLNMVPTETSHEQSSSIKNQEELSVFNSSSLSASSLPMHVTLARSSGKENSQLSSRSIDEDLRTKELICDQQKTDHVTTVHIDDPNINSNICLDSNYDSYDTQHANPTTPTEDTPFEDDREESDFKETKLFLNKSQKLDKSHQKSSRNPYKQLGRITGRASFLVESSLWTQKIGSSNRLDWPEVLVSSRSHSLERSSLKKTFRRESKFKCRLHNTESAPRMSSKDRKLLQMILVIFSSFLVCYLPITITKIFKDMVDWRGLNIAGYILIYLTTCINPIIYVVMSSEYRSAYKHLLLCKGEQMAGKRKLPENWQ